MERIGEKEKGLDQARIGRSQHGCLSPSIGMTTEYDLASIHPPHRSNCGSQSRLIALRASPCGWPVRPQLPKGKIAAEYRPSLGGEGFRKSLQQRRFTICSGSVRQDQAIRALVR